MRSSSFASDHPASADSPGAARSERGEQAARRRRNTVALEDRPRAAGHVGEHLDGQLAGAVEGESARERVPPLSKVLGTLCGSTARPQDHDPAGARAALRCACTVTAQAGARQDGQGVEVGEGRPRSRRPTRTIVPSGAAAARRPRADSLGALARRPVTELRERRVGGRRGELV